jgi:hypothetical protein
MLDRETLAQTETTYQSSLMYRVRSGNTGERGEAATGRRELTRSLGAHDKYETLSVVGVLTRMEHACGKDFYMNVGNAPNTNSTDRKRVRGGGKELAGIRTRQKMKTKNARMTIHELTKPRYCEEGRLMQEE